MVSPVRQERTTTPTGGGECHLPLYFSQHFSQLAFILIPGEGTGQVGTRSGREGAEPLETFLAPKANTQLPSLSHLCPRNLLVK